MKTHKEIKILDECDLIKTSKYGEKVCKTYKDIICGRRRELELSECGHTIITAKTKHSHKLNKLMDDLYNVYRHDPNTENGCSQLPFIGTLREHQNSEFHIYSNPNGIVQGFFVSFLIKYSNIRLPVPTMTFVWVIPQFRRQGLFSKMYHDLVQRRGAVEVDNPNGVCTAALDKIGYNRDDIIF